MTSTFYFPDFGKCPVCGKEVVRDDPKTYHCHKVKKSDIKKFNLPAMKGA